MSHENQNKKIQWRDRLESLDNLSGKPLNKDAAWDKLYGRLRGEQRHKKIAWYWIAAACSAIVLIVSLVMNRNTNKTNVTNIQTAVKQTQKINTQTPPGSEKNENRNDVAVTNPDEHTTIPSSHKIAKGNHRVRTIEVTQVAVSTNTVNPALENSTVTQPVQIAINNSAAAQTAPAKKKLSVVHINELGDPVIEDPDMVRNMDKHKLKFGAGEVYANSPTGYRGNEHNVLTAKL